VLDFVKFILAESVGKKVENKNSAEKHLEDHVIHDGEHGFHHAAKVLDHVHTKLKGGFTDSKLTTNYDGSPSVVFGHHPTNGKFFVSSDKNSKANYTPDDVERNHGNSPELATKLKQSLEYLPKVAPKTGVYQGDLMYGEGDVHDHDGAYHFTPKTIMHSVDKNSKEGKKISKAKLGLAVHTKYHGTNLENMNAGFDPDTHNFSNHPDVHIIDPDTKINASSYSDSEEGRYKKHMKAANRALSMAHPETFAETAAQKEHLKKYISKTSKTGEAPSIEGYRQHLSSQGMKETEKTPKEKAKRQKLEDTMNLLNRVDSHHGKFKSLFDMHHNLQQAKDVLVKSLSKNTGDYQHSIDGKEVPPKGFVATVDGNKTKLVKRSTR
jgi:hypothetical protein